jgi:hypothetical protein
VKEKVFNREEKVPNSCFYFDLCLICGTSPPSHGMIHTYDIVFKKQFWLGIREKGIGLREILHPTFNRSILNTKASVNTHDSIRLERGFRRGRLATAQQFLPVGAERSIRADMPVERLPGDAEFGT